MPSSHVSSQLLLALFISLSSSLIPSLLMRGVRLDGGAPRSLSGLEELSGLTATQLGEGDSSAVFWAHNDSGHSAEVVALSSTGERLLTVKLPLELTDLEDIDAAPCPARLGRSNTCLWLADVGDNSGRREAVRVIAFPAPTALASGSAVERGYVSIARDQLVSFTLRYPHGARPNVEALVMSSGGEALWLFEKTDAPEARVWRGSTSLDERLEPQLLELHSTLSLPRDQGEGERLYRITGADMSDDHERLALRTYGAVYIYEGEEPSGPESLLRGAPRRLSIPQSLEPQGEAVVFDHSGRGLWTASELRGQVTQRLRYTALSL